MSGPRRPGAGASNVPWWGAPCALTAICVALATGCRHAPAQAADAVVAQGHAAKGVPGEGAHGALGAGAARVHPVGPFQAGAAGLTDGIPSGWEAVRLPGVERETRYDVVAADTGAVLRAVAEGGASGLGCRVALQPADFPHLTWRWNVQRLADVTADERSRGGDDFAARVVVAFDAPAAGDAAPGLFARLRDAAAGALGAELPDAAIAYVFARELPVGAEYRSPYTDRLAMVVVRSGPPAAGRWHVEQRDVAADYRRLFGREAPAVRGVQLMTDADNAGGSACALYADVAFTAP